MPQTMLVEIRSEIADSIEIPAGYLVPAIGDTFRFEGNDYRVIDRIIQTTSNENLITLICGESTTARPDAKKRLKGSKTFEFLKERGRKFRLDDEYTCWAGGPYIKCNQSLGAPFMQSHRMSGPSRRARTVFSLGQG